MNFKKITTVFVFIALIALTSLIAFAAEDTTSPANPVASPASPIVSVSAPQAAPQNENDTQWVWGEVVNLDSTSKTITLKYLDYETDQEKDIVLTVNEKTTFENIKSFDEIKVKDTLSIDYTVAPDGKNIAKNIGLESPDSSAAVPAQTVEDTQQVDTQATVKQPATNSEAPVVTDVAVNQTSGSVTQK